VPQLESPQMLWTSPMQIESQPDVQQYGSTAQIASVHVSQLAASGPPAVHLSWSHVPPHAPQSNEQLWQSSVAESHVPSPQVEQAPQSEAHELQSSLLSHLPSPQAAGHVPPQTVATSFTQISSQYWSQQNESTAQISAAQVSQDASSAGPVMQRSWAQAPHVPQSVEQLEQSSPFWHVPSPQTKLCGPLPTAFFSRSETSREVLSSIVLSVGSAPEHPAAASPIATINTRQCEAIFIPPSP
jgi:hypothetical protein